jgi:hypothetical protein
MKNPRGFEPIGSNPRETLRYAQGDITRDGIRKALDTVGIIKVRVSFGVHDFTGRNASINDK